MEYMELQPTLLFIYCFTYSYYNSSADLISEHFFQKESKYNNIPLIAITKYKKVIKIINTRKRKLITDIATVLTDK